MIKKILLTSILVLTVCYGMVSAGEFPILEQQVKIRQAHLEWKGAGHEIGMAAIIEYINEISDNSGASQLSSLMNDFHNQNDTIATLTTHIAINNALRQSKQITTDFRLEAHQQMREHGGKGLALIAQIKTALAEKEGELEGLKNAYWGVAKSNSLEIFDMRVERAQEALDKINKNGYDIAVAQAKLNEIKGKRSSLENALNEKDHAKIRQVHLEMLSLSKELRQIVKDLQVEIPQDIRIRHWIHVGDRVVERTATIISELEILAIDVSELKSIHSKTEADLDKAHSEFEAGNYAGAIVALENLRTDLIELRAAYQELIFGGSLPEDMEVKIEATINALDNTATEMENSIK